MSAATSRRIGWVPWLGLLALCSAYLQGPFCKLLNWQNALGEMRHFDLSPPGFFAVAVIVLELTCSAAILSGRLRWLGAFALAAFTFVASFLANAWWMVPAGPAQDMLMNGFFEHLGLAGAFVYVGWLDLRGPAHGG